MEKHVGTNQDARARPGAACPGHNYILCNAVHTIGGENATGEKSRRCEFLASSCQWRQQWLLLMAPVIGDLSDLHSTQALPSCG